MTLVLCAVAQADMLPTCQYTQEINSNCSMITPTLEQCDDYIYSIYNLTDGSVKTADQNLTNLQGNIYYFNFTLPAGEYIIELCDGSTREVRVAADEDDIMLSVIIALITMLGLFVGLTFYFSGEQSGLTYFFFLGSFIMTDIIIYVVSTIVDDAGLNYAGTLWIVFRVMLTVTLFMFLYVMYLLTQKAISFWKSRKVDNYHDSLDG